VKRNTLLIPLIGAVSGFSSGLLATVLPLYLVFLGISSSEMGVIFLSAPLFNGVVGLVFGAYSDSVSRRKCLIGASILNTGSAVLLPFATTTEVFVGAKIFNGSANALQYSVAQPLALEDDQEGQGRSLTYLMGSYIGGTGLGMTVSGFIFELIGFILTFILVIALLGGIIFLALAFKEIQIPSKNDKRRRSFRSVFSLKEVSWNIKVFTFTLLFIGTGIGIAESFTLPLFLTGIGASPSMVGLITGFSWMLFAFPSIAFVKYTKQVSQRYLFGIFSVVGVVPLIFIPFSPTLDLVIIFYMLYSILYGLSYGARLNLLALSVRSKARGLDTNIPYLGFSLGIALGTLIAGLISPLIGYGNLFLFEAWAVAISGFLFLTMFRDNTPP
jgi:MFS family permease